MSGMRGFELGRRGCLAALALLLAGGPALAKEPVAFGCTEVVVTGRIRVVASSDASAPGDILGQTSYEYLIDVKRLLRGREPRRHLPAVAISHAEMRDDADFWFVLTPGANGDYIIREAGLTRYPYRVKKTCE